MNSVEKSAKTLNEAIEAALAELNASISETEVEVLDEGSKGLFGLFGSRLARVRVTRKYAEEDAFDEDELDVDALLSEHKAPAKTEKPRKEPRPRAPKAEKPAEKPEKAEAADKPAEAEKPAPARKNRPEPVRRVNPDRKPAEAEKPAPVAAAPAEEEAPEETFDALNAMPEDEEETPARSKRRRPRHRSKGHKADKPETAEAPEAEAPAPEKKPLPPKAPARPLERPVVTMIEEGALDPESQAGKAKAFLQEVTRLMGVDVEIRMGTDEEGNVFGYMTGDTLGILIGRRGETLDALQYLTSLRVNRSQDHYTRVTLDTENYRAKREDTLIRLANRMANRAVKTGRRVAMEPMNPYERRIIHSALQANEQVDTHSEGEDPNRHVVITVRK
ncbi:MAG: Jag N-terminal domain-containing protein [Clostridia bacterium]|nr:Jag N-terminal domain-containing protein [Clostridia bacterium]